MCGGHGLHHLIETLAAAPATQPTDVTQTVKLMYARGDIEIETFRRLMNMADAGYLRREDLLQIRETPEQGKDVSPGTGLDRRDSDNNPQDSRLHELQNQLARLLAQAEDTGKAAQQPNLTDEQVQGYLETSQGALFRAQAVQREIAALQERIRDGEVEQG